MNLPPWNIEDFRLVIGSTQVDYDPNKENINRTKHGKQKSVHQHDKELHRCSVEIGAYGIAMIGGCFVIVGALIGAFSAYWLAIRLEQRKDRLVAISKFRSAFAAALAQLDLGRRHNSTHESPDIDAFLKKALLDHGAAIEEFRPFVKSCEKSGYQQAWSEYYEVVKTGFFIAESSNGTNPWSVFEEKIHDVLRFAKT